MKALLAATICLLCLMRTAHAQDKPTIVVNPFKMAPQVSWPYDMKELERQVLELQNKDRTKLNTSADAWTTGSHCLTLELEVEILEWHPRNAAKRALVGLGTGRESAKIRYWLTNQEGKKVFEHDDTIRTEFYASAYSASVGQLAHPLADKIGGRLAETKLE